jgi:predicted MPP superfamily phosphohydrolase
MKLEIGYQPTFEIRRIQFPLDIKGSCSILYLSDFHLNRFGAKLVARVLACVQELDPDIILLGGDYVDTRAGFKHFRVFLEAIASRQHVFAIAGNHDFFFGIQKIKKLMADCKVCFLENSANVIDLQGFKVQISSIHAMNETNGADLNILCLHQPITLKPRKHPYQLVFAGHLHGSQFVFWQTPQGLYPGRWFYTWNRLQDWRDHCLYIISKGLGDTLPIRYNCRKDMIFVRVVAYEPDIQIFEDDLKTKRK